MNICFKNENVRLEFEASPSFLRQIAFEFARLSHEYGVFPILTRVLEHVTGSSGVHEAGRGIDFRDEHPAGTFLYTDEQRQKIVAELNRKYARKDGKPTALWHSFNGGMHHFHLQIAPVMSAYYDEQNNVCPHCGKPG